MSKKEKLEKQKKLYMMYKDNNDIVDNLNYEDLELLLNYIYKINMHLREALKDVE